MNHLHENSPMREWEREAAALGDVPAWAKTDAERRVVRESDARQLRMAYIGNWKLIRKTYIRRGYVGMLRLRRVSGTATGE